MLQCFPLWRWGEAIVLTHWPGLANSAVAFEWPEITWAWVENTNICCSVQESLDFLEIKELGDLGPIYGKWQHRGAEGRHISHCKCAWILFKLSYLAVYNLQVLNMFVLRSKDYHIKFLCAFIIILWSTIEWSQLTVDQHWYLVFHNSAAAFSYFSSVTFLSLQLNEQHS